MAHSSAPIVPEIPGSPQTKTLFLTAAKKLALLVTRRGGKFTEKKMTFDDPHAALSWCQRHRASFVFDNQPDHSGN